MIRKMQPWIINWYTDCLGLFLVPFFFITLALFNLPPYAGNNPKLLGLLILFVLIIDWAHIFAQYPRIFSNPLESKKMRWIYPLSYLLLLPLVTLSLGFFSIMFVDTILVYFVIFHFIKQHFGFVKIFSKTDGPKTKWQNISEDLFIYLSMWTPVISWHVTSIGYDYKWTNLFFKIPGADHMMRPLWGFYFLSCLIYIWMESCRTKRNQFFNIPKNLSIFSAMAGWGVITLLPHSTSLIIFTVTLTHDLSYTYLVWAIGRRDAKMINGRIKMLSWNSGLGFFFYLIVLILISHVVMVIHLELTKDHNWNYLIYGELFNSIKSNQMWLTNFGWSLFFATQAHHYFIDRYLWKREKDLEYMVKTGRYSLS
jgi:hypothetical protein